MERVALYARVSTLEQAENGDSLRMQREALDQYAKDGGLYVVDHYVDDGYTATNLKRPELNRLLDDVRAGKVDRVAFVKLDRWSRGVRNYYRLADVLDAAGVHWSTVFEKYDTSTAAGRLHINIMLSVAENESANTSERIRAVFHSKIKAGEVVTGNMPFGYKIEGKRMALDPGPAAIVAAMFDAYLAAGVVHAAMDAAQDMGERMPYPRARHILGLEQYAGAYKGVEGYCPAIVPRAKWLEAQRILATRAPRPKSKGPSPYVFRSMVFCAECGRTMPGTFIHNKNEVRYNYYRCNASLQGKGCTNRRRVSEKKLEALVLQRARQEIGDRVLRIRAEATGPKKPDQTARQAAAVRAKLAKLRDLYLDDLIGREDYRTKYSELSAKLEALEAEAAKRKAEGPEDLAALEAFLSMDLDGVYSTLDPSERRRLWRSVIERIEVGHTPGDVRIVYR